MNFHVVDAFATSPFKGNPAAVFVLQDFLPDDTMQAIANELNKSETAFVVKQSERKYAIRWFTPAVEVDLCGHATLATAHVLWSCLGVSPCLIEFTCRSGVLSAQPERDMISVCLPAYHTIPILLMDGVCDAIGGSPVSIHAAKDDWLLEFGTQEEVERLQPDMTLVRRLPCRAVIVTARGSVNSGYDFVSRFFAPKGGVDEDPVTGSAHCKLATYWAKKLDKTEFTAYQASPRGGQLRIRLDEDKVWLSGYATTVYSGTFYLQS